MDKPGLVLFLNSSIGQLLIGAILAFLGKYVWDRWVSQRSRVTSRECDLQRHACMEGRNLNLQRLLGVQERKLDAGETEFVCIGSQLDKIKTILEAVLEINLKLCKVNPSIDCDSLMKVLAAKGLDIPTGKRSSAGGATT